VGPGSVFLINERLQGVYQELQVGIALPALPPAPEGRIFMTAINASMIYSNQNGLAFQGLTRHEFPESPMPERSRGRVEQILAVFQVDDREAPGRVLPIVLRQQHPDGTLAVELGNVKGVVDLEQVWRRDGFGGH
jgi:hypothetical protein